MNLRRLAAVFVARNKEFVRDRSALAWNILFPVLIVAGFAFAFSGQRLDLYKVGVVGEPAADVAFFATAYVDFIPVTDRAAAVRKVQRHQLDLVIAPAERRYWINETSPRGYILDKVLRGSGGEGYVQEAVSGTQVRYVDWLLPGVLGMNMMFSALYGVGYVIVRYRKNGVLKRLKATPLTAVEFLTAQVMSRLWLILVVTAGVYFGTDLFIDFTMDGRYLDLLVVFALGAMSIISLGLLIAARTASEEFAGGLLNLISWPMMFLSGVWFSLEGLNPMVQKLALVFPLTHLIDAARAIMIDGAGLAAVSGQLAVLGLMTAAFLALGARLFRWE
jgi:ABC-2 type transport system permease protein